MGTPKLTVAIPTMRRWKGFLEKSLPTFLENDLISAVLICDETGEDADAIQASKWGSHPKLRVHRNPNRLGMYYNKRRCMELATTPWVAVLDSDNLFPESFFEGLFAVWEEEGADQNTVYAAGQILRSFLKTGETEEKTRQFAGRKITRETWNQTLQTPGWNFLLNDGNWVGHRSLLEAWPTNVQEEQIRATDSIRIVRNFILTGHTYYVFPEMRYIHTIHDDSEWLKTEKESTYLLATTQWYI